MYPNYDSTPRASVYLVLRAEALLGSLKFFLASTDGNLRRIQFLAQSDYWEWEIDNLIYSFTNFSERQATWQSAETTNQRLLDMGIVIDAKLLHKLSYHGQWRTSRASARIAPVDMLRQTIEAWNSLIDLAEKQLIEPMQHTARRWNIQTKSDLAKMRKQMPELGVLAEG